MKVRKLIHAMVDDPEPPQPFSHGAKRPPGPNPHLPLCAPWRLVPCFSLSIFSLFFSVARQRGTLRSRLFPHVTYIHTAAPATSATIARGFNR